jgi:energy-coupling factor transporter transmembrane protein EcfT
MENNAFLIFIALVLCIIIITSKSTKSKEKLRWLHVILVFAIIGVYVFWFVKQTEINLNKEILPFNIFNKETIGIQNINLGEFTILKLAIITSLNFLLLFINFVLMVRSINLNRKIIVH